MTEEEMWTEEEIRKIAIELFKDTKVIEEVKNASIEEIIENLKQNGFEIGERQ